MIITGLGSLIYWVNLVVVRFNWLHLGVLFLKVDFDRFWCHIINDIKTRFKPSSGDVLDVSLKIINHFFIFGIFIGAAKNAFFVQSYRMKMAMYPSMILMRKFSVLSTYTVPSFLSTVAMDVKIWFFFSCSTGEWISCSISITSNFSFSVSCVVLRPLLCRLIWPLSVADIFIPLLQ